MKRPEMMIFDYGHTLCYEPEQDYLRGWRAAMEHAVVNPRGITPEQLYEYSRKVYADLFRQMRPLELETDGLKLDKCIFDALGLSFDVTMRELEYIRWCATEPIFPMEGIEDFLALCAELGIRTGVISNLSFSGPTLVRRINECLPFHRFEFIVASSECVFRKPSEHIFRRALGLAGLDAASCWFAGDDVECDVEGAARSGLYPVWFKCPLKCTYKPEAPHTPRCEYLKVASWAELGEILRGLE